jgi:hypothetical protein
MGSHPTLAHPTPERDVEGLSAQLARQRRIAESQPTTRDLEEAFDQLNPDYGIPADTHNPYGQRAMHDREAALALGTRVAVATSRENDRKPVVWLAGQDYRAADAIQAARHQPTRARHDPKRVGPER